MPCRDYDPNDNSNVYNTLSELRSQLAKAPKPSLLCEALSLLEENGLLDKVSKELKQWYADHESKESHCVRLEAAEKLSVRERRLLGIDLELLRKKAGK